MLAEILTVCLAGPMISSGGSLIAPQGGPSFLAVLPLAADDDQVEIVRGQRPLKVVKVVWCGIDIPISDPVQDCELATIADGSGLIILAGGIHESLDLYLVDRDSRKMRRFQTNGGRRLPTSFNGNLGSWPLTEGLDLVLFMYEQEGRLRFRALNVTGATLAERGDLPRIVRGFNPRLEIGTDDVRVQFGAGIEDLKFSHPAAACLDVDVARLPFDRVMPGQTVRREAIVRNVGGRTLRLQTKLDGGPFRLSEPPPTRLIAGQQARVVVEFAPERVGSWQARLEFEASGAVASAVTVLSGDAAAAVPQPIAVPLALRVPRQPSRKPVAAVVVERSPAAVLVAPPAPFAPQARPRGDGQVELRARVAPLAAGGPPLRFLVQNLTTGELLPPIVASGDLQARRVPAAAGDQLAIATQIGDVVSEWSIVEPVAPSLAVRRPTASGEQPTVSVHACRNEPFLICAVAVVDDPRGQERVVSRPLRSWRGTADANGCADLPIQALGELPRPFELVLLVEGPHGVLRSEPARID